MKFAAIADIHGNCPALEAVLKDIDSLGIETIVNLGDLLSGPLEARRTADLLMQRDFPTIRGNHDRWLVETPPEDLSQSDRTAHEQLEGRHFEWLATLPSTARLGDDVFLCHGTPASDTTYWLEHVTGEGIVHMSALEDIEAGANGIDARLILCGHTHIPRVVRLRDGRLVVNPGSVGSPGYFAETPVPHKMYAGTPDACYAILERSTEGWTVTIRHVPYDNAAMAEMARAGNRPGWACALATGWL